jgi:hypothetical protein
VTGIRRTVAAALLAPSLALAQPGSFDGQAALAYARAQVEFGPRVPGTEAARRAGDWIVDRMRERADTVIVQTWTHETASGRPIQLRNIFAQFRPDLADRVLYVVHWDTRPISDSEWDPDLRQEPGPGANDGASGVGLLVALADALERAPPNRGVDLLFTDGEDYGSFGTSTDILLGAAYFAAHRPRAGYRPTFGVVWDMIGDADLRILKEGHSVANAPEVVDRVWATAARLGHASHFAASVGQQITDDHLPLQRAGMRVIDVIDLDYPHHHRHSDTIDKLSAESLRIVGEVALALVR